MFLMHGSLMFRFDFLSAEKSLIGRGKCQAVTKLNFDFFKNE
jgi:hypothetical protein